MAITIVGNSAIITTQATGAAIPWAGGWATITAVAIGGFNSCLITMQYSPDGGTNWVALQKDNAMDGTGAPVAITGNCNFNLYIGSGHIRYVSTVGTPSGAGVTVWYNRGFVGQNQPSN